MYITKLEFFRIKKSRDNSGFFFIVLRFYSSGLMTISTSDSGNVQHG